MALPRKRNNRNRRGLKQFYRKISMLTATNVTIAALGVNNTQLQNNRVSFADAKRKEDFELDQELTATTGYTEVSTTLIMLKLMTRVAIFCLALIIQGTVALVRLMSMSVPIFLILILLLMEQVLRHWIRLGMVTLPSV